MSACDLLVRGGEVVIPGAVCRADVAVLDGRIAAIAAPGAIDGAAQTYDASGKVVFPGVIDPHVHCRIHSAHADALPVVLEAAARGGVTCCIVHILPSASVTLGPAALLAESRDLGERAGAIDFTFHAWIAERADALDDIPRLAEEGVPSFKLFLAYKSMGRMASDAHVLAVMERAAAARGTVLVHCEDGESVDRRIAAQRARGRTSPSDFRWTHPDEAEWLAIDKALTYARLTECRLYVVHVSTPAGAALIADARERGQEAWAETCPQYLELTDAEMERRGPLAKISPPLRDEAANEGLWAHLAAGRLQAVGSDHSPHSAETKARGGLDIFDAPYGAPGVQTMLPVLWDAFRRRGLPLTLLARLLAEGPAKIFGLSRKGAIAPGMDADLVIVDPGREAEIRAKDQVGANGYTLYENRRVRGWPVASFLRGRMLLDGDALRVPAGYGRFVRREPA